MRDVVLSFKMNTRASRKQDPALAGHLQYHDDALSRTIMLTNRNGATTETKQSGSLLALNNPCRLLLHLSTRNTHTHTHTRSSICRNILLRLTACEDVHFTWRGDQPLEEHSRRSNRSIYLHATNAHQRRKGPFRQRYIPPLDQQASAAAAFSITSSAERQASIAAQYAAHRGRTQHAPALHRRTGSGERGLVDVEVAP